MSHTVVVPAISKALTTVQAVRDRFGALIAAKSDAQITTMINAASSKAAVYCRRVFGRQTVRERFKLSGEPDELFLSCGPAYRIVSVTTNGDDLDTDEVETDGYKVWCLDDNGDPVPWYGRNAAIVYECGYVLPGETRLDQSGVPITAAPGLPEDIEEAILQLIGVAVSNESRSDPMTKVEESEGVGRTEFYVQGSKSLLAHPEAETTLNGYKWANVG